MKPLIQSGKGTDVLREAGARDSAESEWEIELFRACWIDDLVRKKGHKGIEPLHSQLGPFAIPGGAIPANATACRSKGGRKRAYRDLWRDSAPGRAWLEIS